MLTRRQKVPFTVLIWLHLYQQAAVQVILANRDLTSDSIAYVMLPCETTGI